MIFMFLQCVSTVINVYVIISPLNSYFYIHWILDLNKYYYYFKKVNKPDLFVSKYEDTQCIDVHI